jgi:tetraacyldisaccharide 4'-kinase
MNLDKIKSSFLTPLSWLWEWFYRVRRSCYEYGFIKREYFKVPVISVGNLSFGGTGKTPTIMWLADYLAEKNKVPVVLTRGYKGKLEKSAGLLRSGQRFRLNPHDYGDEPLMIASKMRKGAVIVGRNRAANLKRFFPDINPDVVLLDDGFQHLKIYRSFNIVLFDATMPLNRYKTAPLGYMREGLTALKDADAIIVSRADMVSNEERLNLKNFISSHFHHGPLWCEIFYRPIGVFNCYDQLIYELADLKSLSVVALTAIASPDSFYRSLEQLGMNIVECVSFSDHYFFTQVDVNEVIFRANQHSCVVICSEKDMVKLKQVSRDPRLMYLKVKMDFISGEDSFTQALGKVLHLDPEALST